MYACYCAPYCVCKFSNICKNMMYYKVNIILYLSCRCVSLQEKRLFASAEKVISIGFTDAIDLLHWPADAKEPTQ
jgi:hypothetical protein